MISARKIEANRANARISTGPTSAAGKTRAAKNARSHGLSVSVLANPERSEDVEALARAIAREGASAEVQDLARRIAEAQIDLVRVRQARQQLISRVLGDPDYGSPAALKRKDALVVRLARTLGPMTPIPRMFNEMLYAKPEGPEKFGAILSDLAARLAVMDRYERRALSRRKFAIRAFDAARGHDRQTAARPCQ